MEKVIHQDLVKFGLIPELVGRMPVITALHALDREALVRILTEPKNAVIKQYKKLFEMDHVELDFDKDALDAVDAILPAGTLSGAPKLRACEIINELEDNKRGIYGGAIGYLGFTGNMDTCIAIRMAAKKNGIVTVQAGGGIVADSVPYNEYMESANKAKAVMNAIERASEVDG